MRFALLALFAVPIFAAGTVVQVGPARLNNNNAPGSVATWALTLTVTGDSSNGTVPSTTLNSRSSGEGGLQSTDGMTIISMVTDPGSTAPTANYDIVINDARGYDLLGGTGANRSATVTENAAPTAPVPINGLVSFVLTNNSVASAQITVVLTMTSSTVAKNGGGGSSGGVTSLAGTTPIDVSGATGAVTVSCATCVVGPSSAVATGFATYDGTTGKLMQSPTGAVVDADGDATFKSLSTGSSPPTCAAGTGGVLCIKEGTAPTGEASVAEIYSKTDHLLYTKLNNGAETAIIISGGALGTPASGVGTNLTGTAAGLTAGITNALKSASTTVDVSAATAPSAGQVLTATASTTATWQTPSGAASAATNRGQFFTSMVYDGDYTGASSVTANQVKIFQMLIGAPFTASTISLVINNTQAASTMYVGIYDSACTTLLAHGSAASSGGTGLKTFTLTAPVALSGWYNLAWGDDTSGVTVASISVASTNARNIYYAATGSSSIYGTAANAISAGALPTACGAITVDSANVIPLIGVTAQ